MVRRFVILAILLSVVVLATSVLATTPATGKRVNLREYRLPLAGGANEPVYDVPNPPEDPGWRRGLDDPMGELYQAGDTYYDYQHNGTIGKMIGVDEQGYIHITWMRGFNPAQNPRHVFYNIWDPSTDAFLITPNGAQVNGGTRAGYASAALIRSGENGGWFFPTYHQTDPGDPSRAHAATAIDYSPGAGAFTSTVIPYIREGNPLTPLELIWPKVAVGRDSVLHAISCHNSGTGIPQRIFYSRGFPRWDTDGFGLNVEWQVVDRVGGVDVYFKLIDTVMVIAPVVACSPVSDRVVIAYSKSADDLTGENNTQVNNDLAIVVSEDGGLNWSRPSNITQFEQPDVDCASGDSMVCNRDTLRLYTDVAAIIDYNDIIHCGFTARTYYYFLNGGIGPYSYYGWSGVWHWDENNDEFSPIFPHYYFFDDTGAYDPGGWQLYAQRPSFSIDPVTNYMYCSIWRYMPDQWSDQGWRMADTYVSKSCNNGRAWSTPVNVTRTNGGVNTPPPGSLSERDPSLADQVTYDGGVGYLHLSYVLDRDAGGFPQDEGTAVLCPMYYQRIPVDSIPLRPLVNPWGHPLRIDSTGMPGPMDTTVIGLCATGVDLRRDNNVPSAFALYQNFPNPFNPTTEIQFDLNRAARVSLKVYNVLGEVVATLHDDAPLTAGAYVARFDGSYLASGVYFYRLEADGLTATKKMVLMK